MSVCSTWCTRTVIESEARKPQIIELILLFVGRCFDKHNNGVAEPTTTEVRSKPTPALYNVSLNKNVSSRKQDLRLGRNFRVGGNWTLCYRYLNQFQSCFDLPTEISLKDIQPLIKLSKVKDYDFNFPHLP